jgi:hypothetical protein
MGRQEVRQQGSGSPQPSRAFPQRYIIRNGLLIDKESFRDDAKRIPVSFLARDGPPPPTGSGGNSMGSRQLSPIRGPRDADHPSRVTSLAASTLDRVMPQPVPPSELPDEWHIWAAAKEKRAFNLSHAVSVAVGGQPLPDLPRYRIFPSTTPSSRQEVLLLAQALDAMLARVSAARWEEQAEVYDLVLSELVRQVWVNCSERGQLLGSVRRAFARLMRVRNERVAQLELTARRLREDLASTDVAAAERIAQMKALSLDKEHAARQAELLAQMRAHARYDSAGLHLALDAFSRLNDEERIRILHVVAATKVDRAQASLLTQAMLSTLPRAQGHAIVREFIDEVRMRGKGGYGIASGSEAPPSVCQLDGIRSTELGPAVPTAATCGNGNAGMLQPSN